MKFKVGDIIKYNQGNPQYNSNNLYYISEIDINNYYSLSISTEYIFEHLNSIEFLDAEYKIYTDFFRQE